MIHPQFLGSKQQPVNVATLLARVVESIDYCSPTPTTRASSVATFTN